MESWVWMHLAVALAVLLAACALAVAVLAVKSVTEIRRAAALIEGVHRVYRYPPRVQIESARSRRRWS